MMGKAVIKWIAETLFGELFNFILGEVVIQIIGLIFLSFIGILGIHGTIKHYKTPKCEHNRRGVCYQCDPLDID